MVILSDIERINHFSIQLASDYSGEPPKTRYGVVLGTTWNAMLERVPQVELEKYIDEDGIRNGGTAMMAWAKIQFSETTATEEQKIRKELLRYCELDTLAMVMIAEYWRELCA